ncbi:MAG TPA: hypothetical protein VKW08_12890 [Xanthobacteraceae bacterium]|nr:hypothetical protein [Xanthobacteraceae bacterium]
MRAHSLAGALALVTISLLMTAGGAAAADEGKYPAFSGQWRRAVRIPSERIGASFDPSKPFGREERPPLTPEYQAIYEANLVDMEKGGQGIDPTSSCLSPGMPRVMIPYVGMEFVVTPDVTFVLFERDWDFNRHIYTDGRGFPANMDQERRYLGYSIGQWVDTTGSGRYDTLEVETRGMKGPRVYDASGIPLHADNETIVRERLYLDRSDQNLMHNDMTIIDHALTRPWVVNQSYRRMASKEPMWFPHMVCGEGNVHITVGKEQYFLSADGYLMPTKKDQAPPDLRYFKKP